jgi:hypothetical protein
MGGPLEQVWREVGAPFDVTPFATSAYWVKEKGWLNQLDCHTMRIRARDPR